MGAAWANPRLSPTKNVQSDFHWSSSALCTGGPKSPLHGPEIRDPDSTLLQALYKPHRGGLLRNPAKVIHTRRARRKRPRRPDERRSRFRAPMTLICDRPAEVADRSVPGHWKGDLTMGRGNRSAIGTLVERATPPTVDWASR